MKMKLIVLFTILVFVTLFFGFKLNYPPYEEELSIIFHSRISAITLDNNSKDYILRNILGESSYQNEKLFPLRTKIQILNQNIWALRVENLLLLISGLVFIFNFLKRAGFSSEIIKFSAVIILISPFFLSIWMFQPQTSLTFCLLASGLYFYSGNIKKIGTCVGLTGSVILLFFSSFPGIVLSLIILTPIMILKMLKSNLKLLPVFLLLIIAVFISPQLKNPSLKNQFSQTKVYNIIFTKQVELEITDRIRSEDKLQEKVIFPLWFRRLGYNKIFITFKNLSQETVNFLDLETLFFQEVHPLGQKSEVIFYWPEIFILIFGIYQLRKLSKDQQKLLIGLFILSFGYYLFSINGSPASRHLFTYILASLILGLGLSSLPKKSFVFIVPIIFWAIWINSSDIMKRPLFWYNNRPFIYSQASQAIKEIANTGNQPSEIYLTTRVGNPIMYFLYYAKISPQLYQPNTKSISFLNSKIIFDSFDLKTQPAKANTYYAGFLGEFIGTNFFNEFPEKDREKIKNLGLDIKNTWKTNDSIAHKYSDYFIIGYNPPKKQL